MTGRKPRPIADRIADGMSAQADIAHEKCGENAVEMRHCDGCGEDYNAFEESHVGHVLPPAGGSDADAEKDAATVCIAHGRFIPCRKDGEHRYTSNPFWAKSVNDYQGSTDETLTWEPAWERPIPPAVDQEATDD